MNKSQSRSRSRGRVAVTPALTSPSSLPYRQIIRSQILCNSGSTVQSYTYAQLASDLASNRMVRPTRFMVTYAPTAPQVTQLTVYAQLGYVDLVSSQVIPMSEAILLSSVNPSYALGQIPSPYRTNAGSSQSLLVITLYNPTATALTISVEITACFRLIRDNLQ